MFNNHRKLTFLMIIAMVLWGGSWVSGKIAATSFPPMLMIFWRYALTTVSFIPMVFLFRQSLKVSRRSFLLLVASGLVLFGYSIFYFSGLVNGLAGAGGVVVTGLSPLLTFLLVLLIQRVPIRPLQSAGLAVGVIGALTMLRVWNFSVSELLSGGNLYFLGAALLWAALTVLSGKIQQKVHFIVYSFYLYAIVTVLSLSFTLLDGTLALTPVTAPFWLNALYLSIVSSSLAGTVYFVCTMRLGSRTASSFMYLVPVSALLFSYLILGEIPPWSTVTGGALAVAAVYIINRSRLEKKIA